MEDKLMEKTQKSIEKILNEGITTNNLDHLYKLIDIYGEEGEKQNGRT